MTKERQQEILELLHKEVKPALGCTEPIAVALAASKAAEILCPTEEKRKVFDRIEVRVSGNILKNGMGVGIPGTGMIGLPIAAALGAVCGRSELGLEVLKYLTDKDVDDAKLLVSEKKVVIAIAEDVPLLYAKVTLTKDGHDSYAVVEDMHDRIVETAVDGKTLTKEGTESGKSDSGKETLDYHLTVREILEFAEEADFDDISFILQDRELNLALANEGLMKKYGLGVGQAIKENEGEIFGKDFLSQTMAMTAAASDARMAGCKLPAMSNSGSGNQGITVSMPVIVYGMRYDVDDERLSRALVLSNLTAIHIKGYLGRLSALCGCVVASTGSSCGIVYLKGGGYDKICAAIKNMIGNITGMVCDGAKVGCAMKVASGVACAIQSSVLALKGTCVGETDGIIDDDVEKSIRNLGYIGSKGMQSTDKLIQHIMICK